MKLHPSDILKARILIVDDQKSNVELLEQLLQEAGYVDVSSTLNSREVCALHWKSRYDLALSSNEAESYLPVIVLPAEPGHKLRALQSGAKDFVSKPFDLIEVKIRIHNMLEVRLLYKKLKNYNELLEKTVQERTAELRESEARYRCLTELACDWYWEQDETGNFTKVGGPVLEMLGIAVKNGAGKQDEALGGWDEVARVELKSRVAARQPFLDFVLGRVNSDGSRHRYQISGQPMFDCYCGYIGYRGIGVELASVPSNGRHGLS